MQFPIKGTGECPQCGSTDKVGAQYIQELKDQKKLPDDAYPNGLMMPVPFFDVLRSRLLTSRPEVPQLEFYFDVCGECLSMYCTGVGLRFVQVQAAPAPGSRPPFLTGN